MLYIKFQILVILLAMIFSAVLLSTIFLANSSELKNNFKINEKDIIKFTREDAKDAVSVVGENPLRIFPIVSFSEPKSLQPIRSEIVNATLSQLLLRDIDYTRKDQFPSFNKEVRIQQNLNSAEKIVRTEPPNVLITGSELIQPEGFQVSNSVSGSVALASEVNRVEDFENIASPEVYFPPVRHEQISSEDPKSSISLYDTSELGSNSDKIYSEEDANIFTRQANQDLAEQTLDLVGILNLNNYFGLTPSPLQPLLSENEPTVSIPKAVLPLEPHDNSQDPVPDEGFFVQPREKQYGTNSSSLSFDSSDDDLLQYENAVQTEAITLPQEIRQLDQLRNEVTPNANLEQSQTDQRSSDSQNTDRFSLQSKIGSDSFLQQGSLNPSFESLQDPITLHSLKLESNRARAINILQLADFLPQQSNVPPNQLPQQRYRNTWHSDQTAEVTPLHNIPQGSLDTRTNSSSSLLSMSPEGLQVEQSRVISLQQPGTFPYFSQLPNKSDMMPPNFDQPISILPEEDRSIVSRQSSPTVRWIQQNRSSKVPVVKGQEANLLRELSVSEKPDSQSQQLRTAGLLSEISYSTTPPDQSVYFLPDHGNTDEFQKPLSQQIKNSEDKFVDKDFLLPQQEHAIIDYLQEQTQSYDVRSHEEPITFYPQQNMPAQFQSRNGPLIDPTESINIPSSPSHVSTMQEPLHFESLSKSTDEFARNINTLVLPVDSYFNPTNADEFAHNSETFAEVTQGTIPPKRDDGLPIRREAPPKECSISTTTVFEDRFVTVTVISKILENVRAPISTSCVTIIDYQTSTVTVKAPTFTNTVTNYIENTRLPDDPIVKETYSNKLVTNTGVVENFLGPSSYTDYFGEGNSKETLKKTLHQFGNNYMEWMEQLNNRNFHIDKNGNPKNPRSLSYGEWPKKFVIDDRFWD